jgi:hypothetical protein
MAGVSMTLQRTNLAGITSAELLKRIRTGDQFFVATSAPNITRMLINGLKKRYQVNVRTSQAEGGIWITPITSDN